MERDLDWSFRFSDPTLAAQARWAEASIIEGGCAGLQIFYAEEFPLDEGHGPTPPVLAPGTYGFAGRVRDANCRWFAQGCADVDLPVADSALLEVVLSMRDGSLACSPASCQQGECP